MKLSHLLLLLPLLLLPSACQSQSTVEGAKQGAIYGALGAAVSSVVWGRNDVVGDAARGAVVGGTVGAVSGAANESKQSEAQKRQADLSAQNDELSKRNQQLELEARLKEQIGPDNTEAVRLLVLCDHKGALAAARRSADSLTPQFRDAGVWIEAIDAQDQRQLSAARALYPKLVEIDDEITTVDEAEVIVLDLVSKLEETREQFGLARRCD